MAWTPMAGTAEEGCPDQFLPDYSVPDPLLGVLGDHIPSLPPGDWAILGKTFERKKATQIAQELSLSVLTVRKVQASAPFVAACRMIEASIAERIARGEFGVLAIAKMEAVGAFRRVVGQAKCSPDERIRFQANLKILEFGGIKPAIPLVNAETPDRLVDQFTKEEAEAFAKTGDFPERFRDQLARLATSALQAREKEAWKPQLEQIEGPGGGEEVPMPRRMGRELVPEDEDE